LRWNIYHGKFFVAQINFGKESCVEKSWKEAIKRVLKEADSPLHYAEISEQILARGYYSTDGATPAATVNAQLSSSVKHDGDKSPFIRVGKGIFSLRSLSVSN
jgi:hypothetical protein